MKPHHRAILDRASLAERIQMLRAEDAESLIEFLIDIEDREFDHHRPTLKPVAEKQLEILKLRREQRSHWWARWEVWVAVVGVAVAFVAIILALKN